MCLEGDDFYFDIGAAKITRTCFGQTIFTLTIGTLKDPNPGMAEGAAIVLVMIGPKRTAMAS